MPETIHLSARSMLASTELFKNPTFNGRLEYFPQHHVLKLFVSAVDWFDQMMQTPEFTEDQVVDKTMQYIEQVRKTCKNVLSRAPLEKSSVFKSIESICISE